jgi:hypothetical protein
VIARAASGFSSPVEFNLTKPFSHTLYSRLNNKRNGAIVIIMQWLHEDDLVGHVLGQEPWEVLSFPAIAEADEVHRVETIFRARRFTRRRGEALHPERELLESVARSANTTSPANINSAALPRAVAWVESNPEMEWCYKQALA